MHSNVRLITLFIFFVAVTSVKQSDEHHDDIDMSGKAFNVFGRPLTKCGSNPVTGFYRDGFCNTGPNDFGTHTVAAVVSDAFLQFSKKRGNDLTAPHPSFPGLKDGDRWCLCVSRWKEAYDARKEEGEAVVPRLDLEATHQKTLETVDLDILKKYQL
ncbi:hypothetical protein PROFUN_08247 [Planoprotostelium fungivorum]|uniref:DUF2237 domain-containing protein n=1 Tax=Planoprotostelium fungivorum TaxID=1890364 RepID=A0A2P6NKD3_9EUKA|nr:hypothetical protein PROFUN_08247 [Planoprotostelium fungivorum]